MEWHDRAFVLAARRHGESGAIVELLTGEHGRHAGLVRGGQSPKLRAVLQPGNEVTAVWRGRLSEHLGTIACELVRPHAAGLLDDPDRLAGLTAAAALGCCCVARARTVSGCICVVRQLAPGARFGSRLAGALCRVGAGPARRIWVSVWISAAARSPGSRPTSPMFRPARGARYRERQAFPIMISSWYCPGFCGATNLPTGARSSSA